MCEFVKIKCAKLGQFGLTNKTVLCGDVLLQFNKRAFCSGKDSLRKDDKTVIKNRIVGDFKSLFAGDLISEDFGK